MHDYTVCDKCGMLVDVGTAIKDRSTALEDGTDKITEHPRYITIEDDDGFVQHFCMKCARDHIDAWLDGDHYGESITISMETGIVLKSVFDRLETERVTYENKKKEEEQQYAKFLSSIEDGTHPIIQAEEEMLNRPFVNHPPEGRAGDNVG